MDLDRLAGFDDATSMDSNTAAPPQPQNAGSQAPAAAPAPVVRARAHSDSGQPTPIKLSPAPLILESARTSKDDSNLKEMSATTPVTPIRTSFTRKASGLSLHHTSISREFGSPVSSQLQAMKPAPQSPKLEHQSSYLSPTNIIPRRSRGMDYSRAATSLHHSILAEEHHLDSSPTISGRTMGTARRIGEYGGAEQSSSSLWSVMGSGERSSSVSGIRRGVESDSDSSSDDNMMIDEDMEEPYITTPHIQRTSGTPGGWSGTSSVSALMSYRDKRPKKQPKRRMRTPMNMAFANLSKSPPTGLTKDNPLLTGARRDSISWQANQLHISSSDASEEGGRTLGDGSDRSVIRKVAAKRGNLLPKTKGFARIRAALAEETMPIDSDFRREAEVVRQVMESDRPIIKSTASTAQNSPTLGPQNAPDDIPDDDMMMEATNALSNAFKKTPTGPPANLLWGNLASKNVTSVGAPAGITTPPMKPFRLHIMSGVSEDLSMEKPTELSLSGSMPQLPSVSGISKRINNKRRRDDDLDPLSFKRRAVSPSLSTHGSPIMQSPMQRDVAPWATRSGNGTESRGVESGTLARKPGRVGLQGMVDTNDGIMRMSIE